ncbi:FeoB-associated Cys-rich membrane protein [Aquibacillus kalidii]|uniref:FeoB-associated Cys-rich membrane protein n=1 Tax=Aquibacillus kalidii TaxID=2762597 RepID=UPI001647E349|nr:FeoB-associated Cys-rich membrane protein [Aquibacillus kalidii]
MLVNLLIGISIFGYAAWTLFSFIKRSKRGKCATCELNKSCQVPCDKSESNLTKR